MPKTQPEGRTSITRTSELSFPVTEPAQRTLLKYLRRGALLLSFALLGSAAPAFADSVNVTYSVTSVGGSQYEYTYDVTGSISSGDLLAIYFPVATSSSITDASATNSSVTTSVLQADSSIPADGEYDITANTDIANLNEVFSVLFTYSGTGTPGTQSFTLYDPTFAPFGSGTTTAEATSAVTPEPATWSLLALGLFLPMLHFARRRKLSRLPASSALLGFVALWTIAAGSALAQTGPVGSTGATGFTGPGGSTGTTGPGAGTGTTGPGGGSTGTALSGMNIGAYTLLSSYRASTYDYYYTYTTTVSNTNSTPYTYVLGTVTSSSSNATVVAGSVEFGLVPALGSASGMTAFQVKVDRRYAFDPSSLSWSFTGQAASSVGTTPSTISINASPTSASYGTGVTLSASVSPTTASGTVTFYDGPVPLTSATLSSGSAAVSSFALPTGSHNLTAVYSGDSTYASSYSGQDPVTITAAGAVSNCSGMQETALVVCLANAFEATLSSSQLSTLQVSYTLANAERWSNLPGVTRNGLSLGSLTSTQLTAALQFIQAATSSQGYQRVQNIRGADNVLNSYAGGAYGSGNYYIAFLGTPSTSSAWQLQLGGHHLAYNHTFGGKYVSGTPYFLGTEPTIYNVAGTLYLPMQGPRDAAYALTRSVYGNSSALLSGTFDDVVEGVNSSTSIDTNYPQTYPTTGRGLLYTSLTSAQQAQVKAMIEAWVNDMDSTTASSLLSAYEDTNALAQTYVGYAGTGTLAKQGDYIRIDGPRVWIEFVVQNGIVFNASYHFHTIWRDKVADYGGDFSSN